MTLIILLVVFIFMLSGAFFLLYLNKSRDDSTDDIREISAPVTPVLEPPPLPEVSIDMDTFVPQDTIYSYHNPHPGVCCPTCDADNPSGASLCQVCGSKLNTSKFF